jgi:hypothetical protein
MISRNIRYAMILLIIQTVQNSMSIRMACLSFIVYSPPALVIQIIALGIRTCLIVHIENLGVIISLLIFLLLLKHKLNRRDSTHPTWGIL